MLLQSVSVSFYSVYSRSRFVRVGRSVCTFGVTRGRLVLLCFFARCGFERASLGRCGVRRGRRPSDHCATRLTHRLAGPQPPPRDAHAHLLLLPQPSPAGFRALKDKTLIETRSEKAMPQYTHTTLISLKCVIYFDAIKACSSTASVYSYM